LHVTSSLCISHSFAASPFLIAGLTAASPKRHWLRVPEKGVDARINTGHSPTMTEEASPPDAEARTVRFIVAVTGPVADPKVEAAVVRNSKRFADKHKATVYFHRQAQDGHAIRAALLRTIGGR
jgi:hypothetical protein